MNPDGSKPEQKLSRHGSGGGSERILFKTASALGLGCSGSWKEWVGKEAFSLDKAGTDGLFQPEAGSESRSESLS